MLYADVKHWGCLANPDNKKAEMTLKILPEEVQDK